MQRKRTSFPAVLAAVTALFGTVATAQVSAPPFIDYQGRLTDLSGNPLGGTNGANYSVQFRIYDSESGGQLVWAEEQTFTVIDGGFSVRLGEGLEITGAPRPPLLDVFDGSSRYLGVTVAGLGGEITPRLAFLSSPFAIVAQKASTAESLNQQFGTTQTSSLNVNGGATVINLTVSGSAQVNGNRTLEFGGGIPGKQNDGGKIGYATFTPGALDIVGAGTAAGTNGQLNRRIKLWAEGGLAVQGPVSASGTVTAPRFQSENYDVTGAGAIHFGQFRRQMLNLWSTNFGFGIQDDTLYSRSNRYFSWYSGGTHSDFALAPGSGGTHLASLDKSGLWVGERSAGYSNPTGLYVRGADGIRIESQYPGYWRIYHGESIGSPGQADFRLQWANQTQFYYWNSQGNAGRSSDRSMKKDIEPLDSTLEKVLALRPVSFRYKSNDENTPKNLGFIAQEVQPLYPMLVTGAEGSLGLSEIGLVPVAVGAIQEENRQRKEADDAQAEEIRQLRDENAALLRRIEALEKHLSIK